MGLFVVLGYNFREGSKDWYERALTIQIFPGGFVEKRFAMFAENDAPLNGGNDPTISFECVL